MGIGRSKAGGDRVTAWGQGSKGRKDGWDDEGPNPDSPSRKKGPAANRYKMAVSENSQSDDEDEPAAEAPPRVNEFGYTDIGQFKRDYGGGPRGKIADSSGDAEMDEAEDLLRAYASKAKRGGGIARGNGKKTKIFMKEVEQLPGMMIDDDDDDAKPALGVGAAFGASGMSSHGSRSHMRTFEETTTPGFAPQVGGIAFDVRTTTTTTTTTTTETRRRVPGEVYSGPA